MKARFYIPLIHKSLSMYRDLFTFLKYFTENPLIHTFSPNFKRIHKPNKNLLIFTQNSKKSQKYIKKISFSLTSFSQ